MAVTSDTLQIVIKLRDQASKGIRNIGQTLGTMRQRVGSLIPKFSGLQVAIAGAFASLSAGLIARSFIKAADAAEGYRVRLSVLLGSQKEANELFKDMADFAGQVSFQYEEIMDSATALAGVMEGGRKEVAKWMPLLADLSAASGLTMQEATSNFIKMYSAGAAAADLFRDRGILAMLGFQAKTAYTAEQTRKMLIKAWEDPNSKFKDAAFELADTWAGLMSMMADRWFQFRLFVMEEGGILDYIKAVAKTFLNFQDQLREEGRIDEWAVQMGTRVIQIFEKIAIGVGWVVDAFRGWKMIIQGIILLGSSLEQAASYVWQAWIKFGHWLDELYIKIMNMRLKILEFFGKLTDEVQDEIKATKQLIAERQKLMANQNVELARAKAMQYHGEARFNAALATLHAVAAEVPYNEKIKKLLVEINQLAEEYRKKRTDVSDDGGGGGGDDKKVDTKLLKAQLTAETKLALEENKTLMAALEADWSQHNIKMKEYFQQRLDLLNSSYDLQVAAIKKQIALEEDPKKKIALKNQLAILEQQHIRTLIGLQMDLTAATKDEVQARKDAADVLAGINARLERSQAAGGGLAEQFRMEQEDLRRQQEEDIKALMDIKAKGYDVEKELVDAKNKHILEQEQLAANQRKQLWQTYVDSIHTTLSGMTQMFNEWYQAAGSKHKELFNLYKAASIAETIIATYSSAQKAYDSLAKVPYIGPALAASAAAAAIAAGLARVQLIRQQEMATGGLVGGVSPTPTSDNIPIKATAGEYMHPVSAVKYYGVKAMDAIRRRLVPRELLMQFAANVPNIRMPTTAAYAAGGPITQAAGGAGGDTNLSMPVSVNLPEQLSFIGRRLEAEIEPVILRVIQEELKY